MNASTASPRSTCANHDTVQLGVFLILVARAPATVWQVHRSQSGVIGNLAKKYSFVNHYSFHIFLCRSRCVVVALSCADGVVVVDHGCRAGVQSLETAARRAA